MNLTVTGIVLKAQAVGENDRLCTMLTDKYGVIAAYARGARNIKNKNSIATSPLVYGSFELYKHKDYYVIDESDYEELHMGLRSGIIELSVAQYLCQLAMEIIPSEEPASDYLTIMRAALYYLSEKKRPPLLVKAATEMRMLSISGYMPDLVMCPECGAYECDTMYFIPRTGQIKCGNCGTGEEYGVELGRGALTALRHSVYADIKKLFAFSIGEESVKQFYQASESYVIRQIEKRPTTLDFLHSVM